MKTQIIKKYHRGTKKNSSHVYGVNVLERSKSGFNTEKNTISKSIPVSGLA